jgi:hypothetical protein
MRWAVHVARMGEEMHTEFWWRNLNDLDDIEGPGVEGRLILNWLLEGVDCIHLA